MTHRPRYWSWAGRSVQSKLQPVDVKLPPGNDLGSVDGKFRMLHPHGLDVRHLISEQRHVLQAGHSARFVLAQGIKAQTKAFTRFHQAMMNPRRLLRQGGADA